ncbi:hypothetical protein [Stenotrophomonas sp.]|uniref:hypothetical protein n=1 Tax=Stenotrophomonas sp. TaxID=69392 RepID=UPI0028B1E062|nr:hypothetical protein [Stenotrophomonas sp.]
MDFEKLQSSIISFAESFKRPGDLTGESLAKSLGIPLTLSTDGSNVLASGGLRLANSFSYEVIFDDNFKSKEARISFCMPGGVDPFSTPSPPCLLKADEFTKKLEAVGYDSNEDYYWDPSWLRQHSRPIHNSEKVAIVTLRLYKQANGDLCVNSIEIEEGDP